MAIQLGELADGAWFWFQARTDGRHLTGPELIGLESGFWIACNDTHSMHRLCVRLSDGAQIRADRKSPCTLISFDEPAGAEELYSWAKETIEEVDEREWPYIEGNKLLSPRSTIVVDSVHGDAWDKNPQRIVLCGDEVRALLALRGKKS